MMIGTIVGYAASVVAARLMYLSSGLDGPLVSVRHEVARSGIGGALFATFVLVLLMGGWLFGLLAGLLAWAGFHQRWRVVLVTLAIALAVCTIVAATQPAGHRLRHIHILS